MFVITIDTPLEFEPTSKTDTFSIDVKNSWFSRKFLNAPEVKETINFAGRTYFEPLAIKVNNECDMRRWMDEIWVQKLLPKADLKVKMKDGRQFILKGAWPVEYNEETKMGKFVMDNCIKEI